MRVSKFFFFVLNIRYILRQFWEYSSIISNFHYLFNLWFAFHILHNLITKVLMNYLTKTARHFRQNFTISLQICCFSRKESRLSILESEIQPLFEDRVKISDFRIFIDSDRKKSELLYDIRCNVDSIFRSCTKVHSL